MKPLQRIQSDPRTVAKLPHFVNLELNGNQISEAGVEAIRSLLHGAGKILGGKRAHCSLRRGMRCICVTLSSEHRHRTVF
jgi:hypothetical protein